MINYILLAYFIVMFKDLDILGHRTLIDLFGSQFFCVSTLDEGVMRMGRVDLKL